MNQTALARALRGAGGSSEPEQHKPIEAPDSLRSTAYARILDIVSEGEIQGWALPQWQRCLFYNETPLGNADGSLNFKNVQIESRAGTQTQDPIKGFDGVENEIVAGVELTDVTPWTHTFTNPNLTSIRVRLSVPTLMQTNMSNGDITGYAVGYKIELSVDGGSFNQVLRAAFRGKTSSKYERSHVIDLPPGASWTVRVTRLSPNSTSSAVQDKTFVESYTEIVDVKLRMPMTALVASIIDAEQFNNIPSRSFWLKGRIIKVPSNYDPDTRTYDGVWDGTFQLAYSNNPAWVFYDIVTNARYGLGHVVSESLIDKWALYTIGVYCDEYIDDGKGGTEPRFTANLYLQQRADAHRVLSDMASMFRGIMYANSGAITAVADMPSDPIYTYTPANVLGGRFVYSGSDRKVRHTVALVSWNDMSDFGRAKVEYVDDPDGIARYGVQPTEVIAVGCTSQGQAHRAGRYILATERHEDNMVSFAVGLDGMIPAPGKIVYVADPLRAGKRMGGRVVSATINSVVVDQVPTGLAPGHTLIVVRPVVGQTEERVIDTIVGNTITVTENFSGIPIFQSVWLVETPEINAQRFRVLGVKENDEGSGYSITALKHVEEKFDFIENGVLIEEPSITGNTLLDPPTPVLLTNNVRVANGGAVNVITADWPSIAGAIRYEIRWRKDNGPWSGTIRKADSSDEYEGAFAGTYIAEVYAIDAQGFPSRAVRSDPITVGEASLPVLDVYPDADGSLTLDCLYAQFRVFLDKDVTSVVFINVAPTDTIILEIQQQGAFTITWPTSVQPVTGIPYVVTPVEGAVDMVGLNTNNEGGLWLLTALQPGSDGTSDPLAVTAAPSPASDSESTDGSTPTAPSVAVTATATGGNTPYTYFWSRTDTAGGTNFTVSDNTVANPTFSIPAGTTAYNMPQTWRCVVTDLNGFTASVAVVITLTRTVDAEFTVLVSGVGFGYCGTLGGPCEPSVTLTATPDNAAGPVTYAWTRVDSSGGANFIIDDDTSATPTFSWPLGSVAMNKFQTWRCTATDGVSTAHDDHVVHLKRDNST